MTWIDGVIAAIALVFGYVIRPYFTAFATRKAENKADQQDAIKSTMLQRVAEDKDQILRDVKFKLTELEETVAKLQPRKPNEAGNEVRDKYQVVDTLGTRYTELNYLTTSNRGLFPDFFFKNAVKIAASILELIYLFLDHDPNPPFDEDYKKYWSKYFEYRDNVGKQIDEFRLQIDKYRQGID